MGAVCCCLHTEDYMNPNCSVYRNCTCLGCFVQNFLHADPASAGKNVYQQHGSRGQLGGAASKKWCLTARLTD